MSEVSESLAADTLLTADRWLTEGRELAIATVIDAWDQAPLPIGSQLLVDGAGQAEGSVSQGLVDDAVIAEAQKTIADQEPRLLSFTISDEMAVDAGCASGGLLRLYVEPIEPNR
ncbi:MAG: XdhC family protein [Pseudomonadota bacterium]